MAGEHNFRTILMGIADCLGKEDIDNIKYLLKVEIPRSKLDTINTGLDLLTTLEDNDYFSAQNIDKFGHILKYANCNRKEVSDRLASLKQVVITVKNAKQKTEMEHAVGYFIKTHLCQQLIEKIERGNIVILRGIAASGKSQMTYWYANQFLERNDSGSSVVCRIQCTTLDDLIQSMQKLLVLLNMKYEAVDTDKHEYILQMSNVAYDKLCTGNLRKVNHLLLFDDIQKENFKIIAKILSMFRKICNLKILATSDNSDFYSMEDSSEDTFLLVEGVTDEEALKMFSIKLPNKDSVEEKQNMIALARELGNLPFGILCAASYMCKVGIGVKEYHECLISESKFVNSVDKSHEFYDYNKGLVAAQKISLKEIMTTLEPEAIEVLKILPFLNKDGIPVTLLKLLLTDNVENNRLVGDIILGFRGHSLAVVYGKDDDRKVYLHGVTRLVLLSLLSDVEKKKKVQHLLQFYCIHMNVDARHSSVLLRNLTFAKHAEMLLRMISSIFKEEEKTDHIKIMECGILTVIGVTFRLHGEGYLSANDYLKQAKSCLFRLIDVDETQFSVDVNNHQSFRYPLENKEEKIPSLVRSESWFQTRLNEMWKSLFETDGKVKSQMMHSIPSSPSSPQDEERKEKKDLDMLFDVLIQMGKTIPAAFLRDLILQTRRDSQDMEHIFSAAKQASIPKKVIDACPRNHLNLMIYEEMVKKGLAVDYEQINEVLLIEVLIVILYNNGRNLHQWKSKDKHATAQCCYDFRLSYLLGQKLKAHNPHFVSVYCLLTERNGMLYHLLTNSTYLAKDEKVDRLLKAEKRFKSILENTANARYFEFGILKVSELLSFHNKGMCFQHLLSCYAHLLQLYEDEQKKEVIDCGIKCVGELQKLEDNMSGWICVPGFHVHIGKFYMATETNIELSHEHFSKALDLLEKLGAGLSHTYFQAALGYINGCKHLADKENLQKGKKLCEELIAGMRSNKDDETLTEVQEELKSIDALLNRD